MNLPRGAVSILNVIEHPSGAMQLRAQLDVAENTARAEVRVTKFGDDAGFSAVERCPQRTLYRFILSCLILASRVERGTPSLAAAPFGPATFPLLSAKAASIMSFS